MEDDLSEKDTIDTTAKGPHTITSLISDLRKLGVQSGMTVLVHSSLSSIGWVCGGAVSVIIALERVLGKTGTLLMPTHSGDLSDPKNWGNPAVPEAWWDTIRAEMPAFDPALTPSRGMGIIPETFRKQKGVIRSSHPNASFAAWGKNNTYLIQDNHLDYQMNEKSPIGRLYELDGYILLLGVGYMNNTSFHLAEYKADYSGKEEVLEYAPVNEKGRRVWKAYHDIAFDCDDFESIGQSYEKENSIKVGLIGSANSRLIRQKELVDYSVRWMELNRK